MKTRTIIPAALAGAAVGYLTGRTRPVGTFRDWNWARVIHGAGRGRQHLSVRNADALLWMALNPALTARGWQRKPAPTPVTPDSYAPYTTQHPTPAEGH